MRRIRDPRLRRRCSAYLRHRGYLPPAALTASANRLVLAFGQVRGQWSRSPPRRRRAEVWRSSEVYSDGPREEGLRQGGQAHQQGVDGLGREGRRASPRFGEPADPLRGPLETALLGLAATGQETWACPSASRNIRGPQRRARDTPRDCRSATATARQQGVGPDGPPPRASSRTEVMTCAIGHLPPEEQDSTMCLVREAKGAVRNRSPHGTVSAPRRPTPSQSGFIASGLEIAKRVREDLTETPWSHRPCRWRILAPMAHPLGRRSPTTNALPVHPYAAPGSRPPQREPSNVKADQDPRQRRPERNARRAVRRAGIFRDPARGHATAARASMRLTPQVTPHLVNPSPASASAPPHAAAGIWQPGLRHARPRARCCTAARSAVQGRPRTREAKYARCSRRSAGRGGASLRATGLMQPARRACCKAAKTAENARSHGPRTAPASCAESAICLVPNLEDGRRADVIAARGQTASRLRRRLGEAIASRHIQVGASAGRPTHREGADRLHRAG